MNWQPIETAPIKDGTPYLAADFAGDELRCATVARWYSPYWATHWMPIPPLEYRPPSPDLLAALAADEGR
jgi:hypothetical protein